MSVAIVGSGPAGFYTAEALLRAGDDVRVDIIERLPTPFGLIRAGVAPDHAKTRNVIRAYDKTARAAAVRYYGNVTLGRDVTLDALSEIYDAVVLATGAPRDRSLAIPGADKTGVYGAAAFVGWYNGHPDFHDLNPELNTMAAAVIGIGNVAVDIARILVKTPEEMAGTDIADHAAAAIHASPLVDVTMFGRRGPLQAKFSNVELREMGELADACPMLDAAQLPAHGDDFLSDRDRRMAERNLATLRGFSTMAPAGRRKRVHFCFFSNPVAVLGDARVTGLRLERTVVEDGRAVGTGEVFDIPCGLVLSAIGYHSDPIPGVPFDEKRGIIANRDGRVAPGVYVVGWAKRGPSGVIGSNKPDGLDAAAQIRADVGAGGKPGREALELRLAATGVRWMGYEDWQRIDAAEIAAAAPGAPRRKFTTIADMLAVLDR